MTSKEICAQRSAAQSQPSTPSGHQSSDGCDVEHQVAQHQVGHDEKDHDSNEKSNYTSGTSIEGANDDSEIGFDGDDAEYPPLDLNYDVLRHIATYYLPGDHGRCTSIKRYAQGSYHDVLALTFEDGWTCIARCERNRRQHMRVGESEYATMQYVRKHTSIPVPEIYFVNHDPNHAVGAAFALMEKLEGDDMYCIWRDLTLEHKLAIVEQIADVLVQLANLNF
jgi:hypothetical protein